MQSHEEIAPAAVGLAAATMAKIQTDRARLKKLWMGLYETESVIRRGQLAYIESAQLLTASKGVGGIGK